MVGLAVLRPPLIAGICQSQQYNFLPFAAAPAGRIPIPTTGPISILTNQSDRCTYVSHHAVQYTLAPNSQPTPITMSRQHNNSLTTAQTRFFHQPDKSQGVLKNETIKRDGARPITEPVAAQHLKPKPKDSASSLRRNQHVVAEKTTLLHRTAGPYPESTDSRMLNPPQALPARVAMQRIAAWARCWSGCENASRNGLRRDAPSDP